MLWGAAALAASLLRAEDAEALLAPRGGYYYHC